jgi:ABC-type lipoprotein export system ATPase subunit
MTTHILEVTGVDKRFKQGSEMTHVLSNISAIFSQGSSYAIMGSSGSGKSTFMHIIAGLDHPTHGTVRFDSTNIYTLSRSAHAEFLNKNIGLVFQMPYLIREFSVIENVMTPGLIAGKNSAECKARAIELLAAVGLSTKINHPPASLSGGQQQRVALARALFNKPAFLLADEPTGSLDLTTGKEIVELLLFCQSEWNMGIIVSTHDSYVAQQMNTIYTIIEGRMAIESL